MTGFAGGLQGCLFDDTLTPVRIPAARVAEVLISRLIAQLDGSPPPERGLVIATELVIGTSG